ncbi:unnamed protein product [Rhizophagus irregularis]|nr:unnamed protein product [Rhizophagus irregularis]
MVDTTIGHAIESVVSMYPPVARTENYRRFQMVDAIIINHFENGYKSKEREIGRKSADEDKVDKSRSSSMESRKEEQTQIKISSKEVTEFITDDNKESQMTNRRV